MLPKICTFPECERPNKARGLCNGHDIQRRKGQDLCTLGRHSLSAPDRFLAHVKKTGTCWLWTGAKDHSGYGKLRINNRDLAAHRVSFERAAGPIPASMMIDHTCHTPACVNPAHLRLATNKQNQENRAGAETGSKSGIRGVSWHKAAGQWSARVGHHGRTHYVGLFGTIEEAEAAAIARRLELYTHNLLDRIPA